MRCPRCYADVPPAALTCVKCGFKTPAGRRAEGTRKRSPNVDDPPWRMKLNAVLRRLPHYEKLNTIRVNQHVGIVVLVLMIGGLGLWAAKVVFHVCFTCAKVEGVYEGSLNLTNGGTANVTIHLSRYGENVVGSALVQFSSPTQAGLARLSIPLISDDFHGNSIRLKTKDGAANLFSFDGVLTSNGLQGEAELTCFHPRAEAKANDFAATRSSKD
ncbi:MAG: hypothetical protein HY774_01370 [Acidobacteria bacterium]|nr:hypothetical protein [Acidobacteriota bacterium]